MYYLVTIGYQDQAENSERIRTVKEKYVIEALSVEEATIVANNYKSGDMRDSESLSIVKMNVNALITKETDAQYYGAQ